MHNEKIVITRIQRFIERHKPLVHPDKVPVAAEFLPSVEPVAFADIRPAEFLPIATGDKWAEPWQSAWFRVKLAVPAELAGKQLGLWFDCEGEACVFKHGQPWQGLTPKTDWYHNSTKYFVPLTDYATAGEEFELLIEAAANDLFGGGKSEYRLRECALVSYNVALQQTLLDAEVLLNLAENLKEGSVRRQRLLSGLNSFCNLWETDPGSAKTCLKDLLAQPAHASALTAWSVGQAHLDLAWLWPLRETKRKGGRTFANALRLLEAYPDYVFGASQAQLYRWMKELYPGLWDEVKAAVRGGRWEIQGAPWVEFDTNLPHGEALIRQFMYGRRFFGSEFGVEPNVLWLPDCFGFSGNLPQIMRGCGVTRFMTQKLSWNETNAFPHHLFVWQGIDGSEVLAHQLPTHDYNFSNQPAAFLQTEHRYAQSDVCDSFLNLYGIGDGGGGPTLNHIEYGLRQRDLEGVCKFKFASSEEFWQRVEKLDRTLLPRAYGELYLEFHRGTYTSQALMKHNNRRSERLLCAAEFVAALQGNSYPAKLRPLWEDALLLQFHDIIPGSSIGLVYADAQAISANIHTSLNAFIGKGLDDFARSLPGEAALTSSYLVVNPTGFAQRDWISLPLPDTALRPVTPKGEPLPCYESEAGLQVLAEVPAWGYSLVSFAAGETPFPPAQAAGLKLENSHFSVKVTPRGSFASIFDKQARREVLRGESNLIKLWEDEPNNWAAWDINHFYRETTPTLLGEGVINRELSFVRPGLLSRLVQDFTIGQSTLRQTIELREGDPLIRISHEVDWKERHKMLRTHFQPDVLADAATYEIQFGVIKRSAKPQNAWEAARFEVPAHRFADLSQPDRGCALFSDAKYGYRARDGELELNLLRSPADVDPEADIHRHSYRYAFYPHAGDYEHSDVLPRAHSFCESLLVQPLSQKPAVAEVSLFSLVGGQVKLDLVKPAESGSGLILRLYEYQGGNADVELIPAKAYFSAELCDLLENPRELITRELSPRSPLRLSFRPFEIKTLLLKDKP